MRRFSVLCVTFLFAVFAGSRSTATEESEYEGCADYVVASQCDIPLICYCSGPGGSCSSNEVVVIFRYYSIHNCPGGPATCDEIFSFKELCKTTRPCTSDPELCTTNPNSCYAYGDETQGGETVTTYYQGDTCIPD